MNEALAGSVQAQRLILEWSGKLQKTLQVNVSSPFEKWLAMDGKKLDDISDAEIVVDELQEHQPSEAVKQEFAKVDRQLAKKKNWLNRRRELYSWTKRAEIVGVPPLPPKRPTKGQRLAWEESIVRREAELGVPQYEAHDDEE